MSWGGYGGLKGPPFYRGSSQRLVFFSTATLSEQSLLLLNANFTTATLSEQSLLLLNANYYVP